MYSNSKKCIGMRVTVHYLKCWNMSYIFCGKSSSQNDMIEQESTFIIGETK